MKGYAGMSVKRAFSHGVIIRPLLAVTKQEIEQYCYNKGIVPRVDPSNNKDTYTRNRFRKYVLPRLKEENPVVHEKFQNFSKFIQEDEDYLQELAIQRMNKIIRKENKIQVALSIPDFESLPMPLQRRGIQLILNYLYNSKLPSSLSSIHIEQVLSFLKRSHPSGSLDFPEGLKVTRTYEECSFGFLEEKAAPFSYTMSVPGTIILPNGDELIAEFSKEVLYPNDGAVFVAPKSVVSTPLVVRSRMNGDRMHVKGMNGSKKIKAIFIEEKIPIQKREEWPIVCDAKGTILWLPLLKQASVISEKADEEKGYIIIRYKSKESSRRINR
jgi:tRNA(Ile)-lysidine synthase